MTRTLILVLALLAIVVALVFAIGPGSSETGTLEREVAVTPEPTRTAPGQLPDAEDVPSAGPENSTRRRAAAPEATAEPIEHENPELSFGNEYLDIGVRFENGAPAKSITVVLYSADADVGGSTELTSEDGSYRIAGLSPGNWRLLVSQSPNFMCSTQDFRRELSVPHSGPAHEFVLVPAARVTGQVVDAEGTPSAAFVLLLREDGEGSDRRAQAEKGSGAFELGPLPSGTYRLQAQGETGLSEVVTVLVQEGRASEGVVLRLPTGGWIDVTVLDAQDAPLKNVDVALLAGEDKSEGGQTDEHGHVRFGPLRAGTWSLAAFTEHQGNVSLLTANVEVATGAAISVVLKPLTKGITVSGTVTRAGIPVNEARIFFFREGVGLVEGANIAKSTANGRYEMLLADPGPYQVMFEDREPMAIMWVEVPEQTTFELDLSLPGGSVSGKLIGLGKHGSRVRVLLEREDGFLEGMLPGGKPSERPDSKGTFSFDNVRPGVYRLRVVTEGGGYGKMLTGIEVGVGEQVEGLELVLRKGASLSIQLTRADGAKIDGASVMARTLLGAPLLRAPMSAGSELILKGLPPGRVLISAQTMDSVATQEVRLEAGEQGKVALVLEAGAFVELSCERNSQPIGAALSLYGPNGDELKHMLPAEVYSPTYTKVVSSSRRRFGPLPPGFYEAMATAADGDSKRKALKLSAGDMLEVVIEL